MIEFRGIWDCFEGVQECIGGFKGIKGGLLDPYKTLVAPLEDLYGNIFGSKHYIMVQLANANKVSITGPFPPL